MARGVCKKTAEKNMPKYCALKKTPHLYNRRSKPAQNLVAELKNDRSG